MGFDIDGLDELQDGIKKAVQKGVDEVNKGLDRINNPDSVKETTPTTCPNCSASLKVSREQAVITCEYCGSQFKNENRSIADSVFEFVEKTQKTAQESIQKQQEIDKAKNEKRAEKKAAREKTKFVKAIIRLLILAFLLYLYYINQDIINPMIRDFLGQF